MGAARRDVTAMSVIINLVLPEEKLSYVAD
jgi:hypothetical protein